MSQSASVQASTRMIDNAAQVDAGSTGTSPYASGVFWEWLWRTAGIQYVAFFVVTSLIYGYQPGAGSSAETVTTFYTANRTWVLAAAALSAFNLLNLLWFATALRATLSDLGQDAWGAAATAASAVFGAMSLISFVVAAALAYSIAGAGNQTLVAGLNDLTWATAVLSSFPRAMLIMSGAFGFWRAGAISNAMFAVGVGAVVLAVFGGFAWLSGGFFAPDGAYSRFVSPALLLLWALAVSVVLLARSPTRGAGW